MTAQGNTMSVNPEMLAVFNMKSIRFLLFIITSMLTALAMTMTILASTAYWHYYEFDFIYENAAMARYLSTAGLCIFIGVVLLLVCTFGFVGSVKKRTSMVNSFAYMLVILLLLQLLAIYLAYSFDRHRVSQALEVPFWHINDPAKWTQIDHLQRTMGCCGDYRYTDYLGLQLQGNISTVTVATDGGQVVLPSSCCASGYSEHCDIVWPSGCRRVLLREVQHYASVLGMLAVSVMIATLLGVIFALLLARCIRRMKSEKVLTAWKVKEHVIMARQDDTEASNHVVQTHFQASMA